MEQLFANDEQKVKFGHYLRLAQHYWPSLVIFAIAVELMKSEETPEDVQNRYKVMNESIHCADYQELHTMKEAIDGKVICAAYEVKPSAIVQPLKHEMICYQL